MFSRSHGLGYDRPGHSCDWIRYESIFFKKNVNLFVSYNFSFASLALKKMYDFFIFCFSAGIFHCYMQYASLKGQAGADVTIKDLGLQTDFSVYLQIQQTWLAFSECLQVKEYLTALYTLLISFLVIHNKSTKVKEIR